jgi:3-oxoadipate enol-lactonase
MDHRGHGRGIRSRRPFRLEDCADDVAALIDQLELGPSIVAGYSMGGPIAQLLWRRHPSKVKGLVLCATAARFAVRREFGGLMAVAGYGLSLALAGIPYQARQLGVSYVLRNRLSMAGTAEWALQEWERNDPAAIIQAGLALGRFDSRGWIGEVDVPTAVVVTTLDTSVSPNRQRRLAQRIPGAATFDVEGTHRACVDEARVFVPALMAACESVSGREASQVR